MRLTDLLALVKTEEQSADPDMEISGVSYDSRRTAPGDLFVAVKGFETDGHEYIRAAVKSGAAAVLCEKAPDIDCPYVLTADTRSALALVSKSFFKDPASKMKLIGFTGTNGKTTSTMLLKGVLEKCLNAKVGLVGTNQNMIGYRVLPTEHTTPESYELYKLLREMADEGCTHVVMEVSSHSLTLSRVEGLRFEVGVFLNLTQDHLDFHGTMRDYARAKARLFTLCSAAAANMDDAYFETVAADAECPVLTFSAKNNDAQLVAKDIKLSTRGVRFCALTTGSLERVRVGIPGAFTVYNALSVIACAMIMGVPLASCAGALASAEGVKGRVELVPTDSDFTIVIDYAHTPDALENVLRSMKAVAEGRVVALFGCGGDRDRTKRPKMGKIAAENADFVIITSDNPRTEPPGAIISDIAEGLEGTRTPHKIIEDRREAIAWAIDNHRPGDVIILAGKGHETYQIVGKTKLHMDEREIVAEHLEKRKKSGK